MGENNEIIISLGLIQVIGFAALGFLIRISLSSYLSEKGKNLATKEDIKGITEKVEQVKSDFQVQTQAKLSNNLDRKQALINLYESYHNWFSILIDTQIATRFTASEVHKFNENFESAYTGFQYKLAQVEIFHIDGGKTFWELVAELREKATELSGEYKRLLVRLKHSIEQQEQINNSAGADAEGIEELLDKNIEERHKFLQKYFDCSYKFVEEVYPKKHELAKAINTEVGKID